MRVPFMPPFDAWDGAVFDAGDSERVEPLDEFFGLGQEFEQRRVSISPAAPIPQSMYKVFILFHPYVVYHAGEVARAEAVVDVDDGDAARAGVEHREQRRKAAERRAVAYAGRDGYDGAVGEAAYDACQSAFPCRLSLLSRLRPLCRRYARAGGAAPRTPTS